jgi:hypothetical protein
MTKRMRIAIAVAGMLAVEASGPAHPRSWEVSLASIESESVKLNVGGDLPADAGSSAADAPAPGNPLWAIPISKLSATRDRPLFSVSRRPPTPAAPAAPAPTPAVSEQPPAPETPPFTLVGTIIGENSRIGIFFDETSKTATGIREGGSASGWTLRSLDQRSATVEGNGRTVTLDLPEPSAQEGPAPRASVKPKKHRFTHDNSDGL